MRLVAHIGTAANGRSRRYRYYTCFSKKRYGGYDCQGTSVYADADDKAVLAALHAFYSDAGELLAGAVAAARREYRDAHADRREELAAVDSQLSAAEATIDRYLTSFDAGTMDDETAGARIRDLRRKATQLKARHDEPTEILASEPAPPAAGTVEQVRAYLAGVIAGETSGERKRAIEALTAEIRINQDGRLIPVFKIPGNAVSSDDGSRTGVVSGLDASLCEPPILYAGEPLPVRLARSRARSTP